MNFHITGLQAEPFQHLFGLSEEALAVQGAKRYVVDEKPGFPDRITLEDVDPGQSVLLLNYLHQPAESPYRASHAIFVREDGAAPFNAANTIPEALRSRTLSLRAFDARGMMRDADLVEGRNAESLIERLFADPEVAYIHAHFARRGCFACRIDRA